MQLAIDSINFVASQFMNHGISAIDALDKVAIIWNPVIKIRRLPDFTNWSAADHAIR